MWADVNRVLKQTCPAAHEFLKRIVNPVSALPNGLRAPRRIAGRLVWTSSSLLTAPDPEPHIVQWVSQSLFDGATFFDVGAHYGWIAIAAARRVGSSGRVAAFEASPTLLDVLSYHKWVNRLRQLEIVGKAVSNLDARETPFFLLNRGLSFRNSLTIGPDDTPYVMPAEKTTYKVDSVTLDQFVANSRLIPDAIKIDVEGAELLVLQGAERLIARYRPDLILGVHPYWLPRSQSEEQIFEFLDRYEYEMKDRHIVRFGASYLADYLYVHRRPRLENSTAATTMITAQQANVGA